MLDLWLTTFLDASVKGLALCLMAGAAAFALRRASAASRHLVWRLAFVGLLALPALAVLLPEWRLALPVEVEPLREALPARPLPEAPAAAVPEPPPAPAPAALTAPEPRAFSLSWREAALGVWLAGFLVVLAPLGLALLRVRWQGRRARPIEEGDWVRLLDRVRADLGVHRPVTLVEGNEWAMPMTWGWRRPVVLLPAGAEDWPVARRRAVLLHELAHVARGDYLTQLGAEMARALYWFNPLVWRAARALRLESEHACDDRVLTAGAPAADYAGDLLDIARSLRAGRMAAPAGLAMARPSELTGRLLAVLDTGRNRRSVSRWLALPAWIAAACVVLPLAALTPAAKPEEKKARAEKPGLWERFEDLISNQGVQTHEYDDGQNRFKIRMEGKIELTPDWSGITRLSPGAEMRVEEGRGIGRRRVDIRPDAQGRPVYTFWVNGFERPFDAEARQWLKSALLRFVRNSGYEADRRVAGFLKRQGPEGVLAEISQIEGDYGKQIYFEQLFKQTKVSPEILTRALKQAGREIDADYHLDETLQAAIRTQELTAASTQAFAEAAAAIEAPYHAERALTALLEHGQLNAASLTAVLRAARGLDSDYHLGELLKRVAGKSVLADPGVRQAYFEAVQSVESDFHRRDALTAMLRGGKLGPEALAVVLQAAGGIGSDHDRASLLIEIAERYSLAGSLREAYLKAAASIGSEYDRNRAEAALGRQRAGR